MVIRFNKILRIELSVFHKSLFISVIAKLSKTILANVAKLSHPLISLLNYYLSLLCMKSYFENNIM